MDHLTELIEACNSYLQSHPLCPYHILAFKSPRDSSYVAVPERHEIDAYGSFPDNIAANTHLKFTDFDTDHLDTILKKHLFSVDIIPFLKVLRCIPTSEYIYRVDGTDITLIRSRVVPVTIPFVGISGRVGEYAFFLR